MEVKKVFLVFRGLGFRGFRGFRDFRGLGFRGVGFSNRPDAKKGL